MANGITKQGKVRNALERLDSAEAAFKDVFNDIQNIADFINKEKKATQAQLAALADILQAAVMAIGEDLVEEKLKEVRQKRQKEQEEKLLSSIQANVEQGTLLPATEVKEESFVLVEGEQAEVKQLQFVPARELPELVGKGIGDSVQSGDISVTVKAIYEEKATVVPVASSEDPSKVEG